MSAKAVSEHYGKTLLARHLSEHGVNVDARGFLVRTDVKDSSQRAHLGFAIRREPWAKTTKLVAKPDQLIKRTGQGRFGVCQQDDK